MEEPKLIEDQDDKLIASYILGELGLRIYRNGLNGPAILIPKLVNSPTFIYFREIDLLKNLNSKVNGLAFSDEQIKRGLAVLLRLELIGCEVDFDNLRQPLYYAYTDSLTEVH